MAAPITWRNVDTANLAQSAVPLAYSQQSINGAFDAFQNILRQRQEVDNANTQAIQEVGKQNFLDALAQARTPEQMAALQQSGQLDALRQSMGTQARAAVRGADEARLTSVRQQTAQEQAFNAAQLERSQVPLKDEIASLTANRDFAGARALAEQHPELLNRAALFNGIATAERNATIQARDDAAAQDNAATRKLNLTEAQTTARERAVSREVDATVRADASAYQTRMANNRQLVNEALLGFSAFDIPRKTDGSVDMSQLTPTQIDEVDAFLASKGNGVPTLDVLETGDTEAAVSVLNRAREAGATPADMARIQGVLPALLGTTAVNPIGNDAQRIAVRNAQQDALEADAQARLGVVYTPGTAKDLMTVGNQAIDGLRKQGTWRNGEYRRQLADWVAEQGVKTKDKQGNEVRVLPSPEKLAILIQQTDQDWIGDAGGDDLKDALDRWQNSTEAKEGAKTLMESNLRKIQRTVLNAAK